MPADGRAAPGTDGRQRIDKWLWFARLAKTRTLAQKLALSGRVRVNREKCESASRAVKVNDVLTIVFDSGVKVVKVMHPGIRRGPSADARLLYEDLSPPPAPAAAASAPGARPPGSGRPTKRDQRRMAALKTTDSDDFS
jgi:ribosome-associated heat shock protein Hsp15